VAIVADAAMLFTGIDPVMVTLVADRKFFGG
jgi:hypothetical protein